MGATLGDVRSPYDRNQFGGRLGGAFIPNKFFFFADVEATNARDSFFGDTPFAFLTGFFPKLYLEKFATGRLDYTLNNHWQAFGRYSFANNQGVVGNPSLGGSFIDGMNQKTDSHVVAASISHLGNRSTDTFAYGFTTYSQELIPDPGSPLAGGFPRVGHTCFRSTAVRHSPTVRTGWRTRLKKSTPIRASTMAAGSSGRILSRSVSI